LKTKRVGKKDCLVSEGKMSLCEISYNSMWAIKYWKRMQLTLLECKIRKIFVGNGENNKVASTAIYIVAGDHTYVQEKGELASN
jgi:hypothetical protein